ncbi:MAG: hypothetical protein U0838_15370 [Chloroflexota bacterium]
MRDGRPKLTVGAAIVFSIGAYAYHPALMMHVLLAGLIALVNWRQNRASRGSSASASAPRSRS